MNIYRRHLLLRGTKPTEGRRREYTKMFNLPAPIQAQHRATLAVVPTNKVEHLSLNCCLLHMKYNYKSAYCATNEHLYTDT